MTDRISFKDAINKVQDTKINSDLTNLAHALVYVQQGIQELNLLQGKIESLAANIEAGQIVDVSEVKKLYDQANNSTKFRG